MHGPDSRLIDLKTTQLEWQTLQSQGPDPIPFPRICPAFCRNRACVHHEIPLNYYSNVYCDWDVGEDLNRMFMSRLVALRQFLD